MKSMLSHIPLLSFLLISQLLMAYRGAGIIPYFKSAQDDTYMIFGRQSLAYLKNKYPKKSTGELAQHYSDFGGHRDKSDETAENTAVRECLEESHGAFLTPDVQPITISNLNPELSLCNEYTSFKQEQMKYYEYFVQVCPQYKAAFRRFNTCIAKLQTDPETPLQNLEVDALVIVKLSDLEGAIEFYKRKGNDPSKGNLLYVWVSMSSNPAIKLKTSIPLGLSLTGTLLKAYDEGLFSKL